jgi:hypothetical protein
VVAKTPIRLEPIRPPVTISATTRRPDRASHALLSSDAALPADPPRSGPGDKYVDWVGLSAYGEDAPGYGWNTFAQAFNTAYLTLTKLTKLTKPALF